MSHLMNLTDSQWYNLMCGMIAGLKLKDLTLPNITQETVLNPINLGGWATIGFAVESKEFDPETSPDSGSLAVFTHDVNIEYSGFTIKLQYNSQRIRVDSIESSLFGDIEYDISTPGIIYVAGLKGDGGPSLDEPDYFNGPTLLFNINYTVLNREVTVNNPIEFKFVNGTYTDTYNTTLMRYVWVNDAYYLFFITPILNVDGGLYNEIPEEEQPLAEIETSAPASNDGVYCLFCKLIPSSTEYGLVTHGYVFKDANEIAVAQINYRLVLHGDTNRLAEYEFLYLQDEYIVEVSDLNGYVGLEALQAEREYYNMGEYESDGSEIFFDIRVRRADGEPILIEDYFLALKGKVNRVTPEYDELGHYIEPTRDDSYIIYVEPFNVVYTDFDGNSQLFNGYAGGFGWSPDLVADMRSYSTITFGGGAGYGWGAPGSTSGTGGVELSGQVFSDKGGLIYVSIGDGPKLPVWLEPGWNDVNIWYPFIFPDAQVIDATINIDTNGGYILIPAGFKIKSQQSKQAPPYLESPKPTDKIKFKDFIDYQLIRGSGDKEEDCIENINLDDFTYTDLIIGPKIILKSDTEEININDLVYTDLILGPRIINSPATEEITIEDFVGYESEEEFNGALKEVDGLGLDDFIDIHKEV